MKNGTPSLAGSGRSREHYSGNRVLVPYRPFEGKISSTSSVQLRYARAQKWMLSNASSHAMPSRGQRAYQTPAIHGRYDWWGRVKSASRWAGFSLFSFILCLATSVETQQQKKKKLWARFCKILHLYSENSENLTSASLCARQDEPAPTGNVTSFWQCAEYTFARVFFCCFFSPLSAFHQARMRCEDVVGLSFFILSCARTHKTASVCPRLPKFVLQSIQL